MTLKITILLFLALNCAAFAVAQNDTVYLKKEAKKRVLTDRPPQTFYAELGGPSPIFSANYDRRFNKRVDGMGFRAGIGYSFDNQFPLISFPLGINYLVGDVRKGRFFEIGFNETIMYLGNSKYGDLSSNGIFYEGTSYNTSLFMTSLALGYRSQPINGGFNFRAGLLPLLIQGNTALSFYLSFGYNF